MELQRDGCVHLTRDDVDLAIVEAVKARFPHVIDGAVTYICSAGDGEDVFCFASLDPRK
jgi:hypothetical protein